MNIINRHNKNWQSTLNELTSDKIKRKKERLTANEKLRQT